MDTLYFPPIAPSPGVCVVSWNDPSGWISPTAGRPVFGSSGRKLIVPDVKGWPLYVTLPETGNRLPSPSFGPQPIGETSPAQSSATARMRCGFRGFRMDVVPLTLPFDRRLVGVGTDDLAPAGAAEPAVGDAVDAVLEELDRAVAEEEVHPTRVEALEP